MPAARFVDLVRTPDCDVSLVLVVNRVTFTFDDKGSHLTAADTQGTITSRQRSSEQSPQHCDVSFQLVSVR